MPKRYATLAIVTARVFMAVLDGIMVSIPPPTTTAHL